MPKFFGELQQASLENLASDPSGSVAGRIWRNSTEERVKTDDGTDKRALLRNDQKCVIGNNGTANNNIRFNRAANAVLQLVTGGDTAAEGSLSAALAQLSARVENYTDAGKPAAGNAGRLIYLTDTQLFKGDNGSSYVTLGPNPTTTKGDITVHNGSLEVRLPVGTDGFFIKANSATSEGVEWASGAANLAIENHSSAGAIGSSADWVLADASGGAFALSMPAVTAGKVIYIKKTDSTFNSVTLTGVTTVNTQDEVVQVAYNGSSWEVLHRRIPSAWTSFTMTDPDNFGTVTNKAAFWKREGDSLRQRVSFNSGSPVGDTARIYLPTGLNLDTAKLFTAGKTWLGPVYVATSTITNIPGTGRGQYVVIQLSGQTTKVGISREVDTDNGLFVPAAASIISANTNPLAIEFLVPISGWNG